MTEDDEMEDFGFSFVDDEIEEKISRGNDKAKRLYDAIEPFLDNLAKNPEKTTINWPNRAEKIKGFKAKLKNILEEK